MARALSNLPAEVDFFADSSVLQATVGVLSKNIFQYFDEYFYEVFEYNVSYLVDSYF